MRIVQLALIVAVIGVLAAFAPQVALVPVTDAIGEVTEAMEHLTDLTVRIETGMEKSS